MNANRVKFILLLLFNLFLVSFIIFGSIRLYELWQRKSFETSVTSVNSTFDKENPSSSNSKRVGMIGDSLVTVYYPLKDGKVVEVVKSRVLKETHRLAEASPTNGAEIKQLLFITNKIKPAQLAKLETVTTTSITYGVKELSIEKPRTNEIDYYYLDANQNHFHFSSFFVNPETAKNILLNEIKLQLVAKGLSNEQAIDIQHKMAAIEFSDWYFKYEDSQFILTLTDDQKTQVSIPLDCLYEVVDSSYLQGNDLDKYNAYIAEKNKKIVALTFDDGPDPTTTPQVLDILKHYHAKGTFFIIGSHVAGNEAILKRQLEEGHQLGNHTWSHPRLPTLDAAGVSREINMTQDAIFAATGVRPRALRPPYGEVNGAVLQAAQLPAVEWSVDSLDWKDRTTNSILARVKTSVTPGGIILFHDIHQTTVDALPTVLDYLVAEGYEFVTVDELLGQLAPQTVYYDRFESTNLQ